MSFALLGLGTALPETCVSLAEATAITQRLCCESPDQADMAASLYRQTGIGTRHLAVPREAVRDVLDGTRHSGSIFLPGLNGDRGGPTTEQRMKHYAREAAELAVAAARHALAESRLPAEAVTHLVTVSCTGFSAPGVDVALIKRLGLPPTTERVQVGFMGCHGALNGLRVARALAEANRSARVLLCAVELCSHHYHYGWDPKRMVANALFADGAAAVVGGTSETQDGWHVAATGSCLFPDTEYAMTWTIGNRGFEMTLSTRVPALLATSLRPWLEAWLADNGLSLDAVGSWAVHPGGPRILDAVEEALGLASTATAVSREVLAECGNMSSPTVLFVLDRLRRRGAPRPCLALGFGPGLMAEAVLFR